MENKNLPSKSNLDYYRDGYQDGIVSVLNLVHDYTGHKITSQAELIKFVRRLELDALYPPLKEIK